MIRRALTRLWRRRESEPPWRWYDLAEYNGRVARGVKHTPEYDALMAIEQATFDAEQQAAWAADPNVIVLRGAARDHDQSDFDPRPDDVLAGR